MENKALMVDNKYIGIVIWSEMFDGKSVIDLMSQWDKMPYEHVKMVIANEGGYIDDDGIIHRK